MEPVTHFLTGACIGRAGLNRRTAYATLAATLAAEAPDMDVFWSFAGPVVGLQHHRGITHTLIAAPAAVRFFSPSAAPARAPHHHPAPPPPPLPAPAVALIITGFVWTLDR